MTLLRWIGLNDVVVVISSGLIGGLYMVSGDLRGQVVIIVA